VLRYRGRGALPPADAARVAQLPGAVVIDASPRMLLVEADDEELQRLVDAMTDWMMAPERDVPLLDTRRMGNHPSWNTDQ